MNRYAPHRPRAAFAMIAAALAALNFAVLVVLPAVMEASDAAPAILASAQEPHVDSGVRALEPAGPVRERRHHLVARGVANGTEASGQPWAGSPD